MEECTDCDHGNQLPIDRRMPSIPGTSDIDAEKLSKTSGSTMQYFMSLHKETMQYLDPRGTRMFELLKGAGCLVVNENIAYKRSTSGPTFFPQSNSTA